MVGPMANGRNEFYRWLGRKFAAAGVLVCALFAFLFGLFVHAWSAGTIVEYLTMAFFLLLAVVLVCFGGWLWNKA